MSRFGTSVRGSRFDTISVQHEKKRNLLCSVVKSHLDVKILHIITCYIYKIRFVFTNKSRPYTVIINKKIRV